MNEELRNEIIRRWGEGASQRTISRLLGIARKTVKSVLVLYESQRSGKPPSTHRRPSLLDAYETAMQDLVSRYPNITITRMLEELRSQGFSGGYTIVRDRMQELRPDSVRPPVVRFETGPGAQAQMDYSPYDIEFTEEGRRRVHAFSYVLGYSRRQYLRFVETQDFTTTIQQHVRAFEHLGGVAATCLYDNMKVVVTGHHDDVPIYNARFLSFATHYGYRPVACRPRRPQTKGKVERPFHYVEVNLLNGRTFRSLAHLNDVAAKWLAEVADVRIHAETKQSPLERHALEQPHLIPLPTTHFETAEVVYRTVSVEGFVVWKQNKYSVPWRYLGQVLPVRITPEEVIIYSPQLDTEIARHSILSGTLSQQRQLDPTHHPAPNDTRQRHAALKLRYEELGSVAVRFLEGLTKTQRYHGDHAQRVLAFLGTYSRADVLAALERAVRYGAYAASSVERILASQARPLGFLEKLASQTQTDPPYGDNSPAIEPRSTKEYQLLLPEDPADAAPPPNELFSNDSSSGSQGKSRKDEPPEGVPPVEECPF
jgi:transposase